MIRRNFRGKTKTQIKKKTKQNKINREKKEGRRRNGHPLVAFLMGIYWKEGTPSMEYIDGREEDRARVQGTLIRPGNYEISGNNSGLRAGSSRARALALTSNIIYTLFILRQV